MDKKKALEIRAMASQGMIVEDIADRIGVNPTDVEAKILSFNMNPVHAKAELQQQEFTPPQTVCAETAEPRFTNFLSAAPDSPKSKSKRRRRLSDREIYLICQMYENNPGFTQKKIAEMFNIHHTTVSKVLSRENITKRKRQKKKPASADASASSDEKISYGDSHYSTDSDECQEIDGISAAFILDSLIHDRFGTAAKVTGICAGNESASVGFKYKGKEYRLRFFKEESKYENS